MMGVLKTLRNQRFNSDMKVKCLDIKRQEYEVETSDLSFRPAVYGVIIENSKILLSRQWDGYDFPGGGVHLGERLMDALRREVKEETGLDVEPVKTVSCKDSFFKLPYKGNFVQSIHIYYLCRVVGGKISTEFLEGNEKDYAQEAEWIDLNKINDINFVNSVDCPEVIRMALKEMNND